MKEKKKVLIHLTIDEEAKKAFQVEADRQHVSVSYLLNQYGWMLYERAEEFSTDVCRTTTHH